MKDEEELGEEFEQYVKKEVKEKEEFQEEKFKEYVDEEEFEEYVQEEEENKESLYLP